MLGQILTNGKFISPDELQYALDRQRRTHELLGEILVDMGVLEEKELEIVLSIQDISSPTDAVGLAAGTRRLLGELLLRGRRITLGQLEFALKEQQRVGERLGEIFVRFGLLSKSEINTVLTFQKTQSGEIPGSELLKLGTLLLATGYISSEELERALACKGPEKKLGQTLVELGHVQSDHVDHCIRLQYRLVTAALITALSHAREASNEPVRDANGRRAARNIAEANQV
ncbi:MAG: hypothetical protein A2078_16010 [Nitrospirae bacterium GWC2_57_9]|nr:MAG: hypothetical protein A2078_16010 [Nitrospirae bacterium GWC2_57_9]